MHKFSWMVMTNCDPTHEREFNEWYDDVHLKDLLRVPGIVAASRSKLTNAQMTMVDGALVLCDLKAIDAKYKYLACYSVETDNISAVLEAVKARSGTSEMEISPHLTEAYTVMYENI